MSVPVQNNTALESLAKYGCKCPELYATSVFVISFGSLKLCMFEFLKTVNEWNSRELEARAFNVSNTKQGGRSRFDMDILVACCLIRTCLGLTDHELVQRINNDLFVRAALCSLLDRTLSDEDLPSYSTLQKYQSQWAHDGIISKALEDFTQKACMYAEAHVPSDARHKAIEHLPLTEAQKEEVKSFGRCMMVDSAFFTTEINHLPKTYFNALKEGRLSDVTGLLPFLSEAHKRMDMDFGFKYGKYYHGLKISTAAEATTGLIIGYTIAKASTHDLTQLLPLEEQAKNMCSNLTYCLGDSIYNSKNVKDISAEQYGITVLANNRRTRKPLTTEQIQENRAIGRLRCFVEHVFSFMKHTIKLKLSSVETARLHIDCQFAIAVHNAYRLAKVI